MAADSLDPLKLPMQGLQLIEASAGTGKTYTIAALYVRLVLGHHQRQPLLPPDILVLTFTEAAAGELRDRIRRRLVEAAAAFRTGTSDDALLQRLLADHDDPAAREQGAWRLAQAAQWLDDAAISTIHAWCLRILREHAFDSGMPFRQTLLTDLAPLQRAAVRDVWRQRGYRLAPAEADQLAALFEGPDALLAQLRPLLADLSMPLRDGALVPVPAEQAWAPWRAAREAAERLRQPLVASWREQADVLVTLIADAMREGHLSRTSYKPELLDRMRAAVDSWCLTGQPSKDLLLFSRGKLLAGTKKGKTTPSHPWFDALDDWLQASDAVSACTRLLRLSLLQDFRVATDQALQQQLSRDASLGLDDLLRRVAGAIQGDDGQRLVERLRLRHPVALIDEFQDTDPLQFGIFERLYRDQPELGLLLIGDPKQAIYSFRGADLPTYLRARSLSQARHTLNRNFRTVTPLIDGLNQLLGQAERRWPEGVFATPPEPAEQRLAYGEVLPAGRQQALWQQQDGDWRQVPPLQLALPDDLTRSLSRAKARELLAARCADTLAGWLGEGSLGRLGFAPVGVAPDSVQPVRPGDIAVLVRTAKEARVLRRHLSLAGVPSVFGSDRDSVWRSAEAAELQCWLEAFEQPSDEGRLRRALATPSLGRSLASLAALRHDEQRWEDELAVLQTMHQRWQRDGVLAALRAWLFHHQVPARLLHPERPEGERALTNLLHLAELLEQAAVGMQGQHALIRHLAEARVLPPAGQDEALVRLESDSDRVRIVTLHQSKGLEYPLVCLPFAALPPSRPGQRGPVTVSQAGSRLLDLDTGSDSPSRQLADLAERQESLRLFYVGVTRPQHLLWLALAPVIGGNGMGRRCLQDTPWAHLLTGTPSVELEALPAAVAALIDEVPAAVRLSWPHDLPPEVTQRWQSADTPPALLPALPATPLSAQRWWVASYSALAHGEPAASATIAPETPSSERFAELALRQLAELPRGAEIGTFWHDLLEWMAEQGFASCAADPLRVDAEITRRCALRGWEDQREPLQQAARHWLQVPLRLPGIDGPGPSLAELSGTRPELEFWLAVGDVDVLALDRLVTRHALPGQPRPPLLPGQLHGLFKGFIDLVFCHDGRYYVADYKSNHLGPSPDDYRPERLVPAILHHRYELQYCLYLLALHRLLASRLADYDYDRHIGGAVYLFLRGWDADGRGIHVERPPRALIEALDRAFSAVTEVTHAS